MTVTYHVGDTRAVTATLPDGSIDLIASSPPFLALRSYLPDGHESKGDEIGSETNPAEFIDTLLALTAEWGRVLAPHGSIAIELGDTYSGSGGAGGDYNEGGLRDGQGVWESQAARARAWKMDPSESGQYQRGKQIRPGGTNGEHWPRAKSLALIPQLYAVALAYGINPLTGAPSPTGRWLVRNVIVWHRPNPAVGALGDKVRPSTSYIVVATRSPKRWFDLTAVRKGEENVLDTNSRGTNGVKLIDQPMSLGGGKYANRVPSAPGGAPPLDAWFDQYDGTHDTWTLTTQPSKLAHYAMWPAKLTERLVLMMCPGEVCQVCGEPRRRVEGAAEYVNSRNGHAVTTLHFRDGQHIEGQGNTVDSAGLGDRAATRIAPTLGWTDCTHDDFRSGVVLDPFAGSGTTLAVADLHGRDAIGIDFDQRNHDLYPRRYDEVKRALFGTIPEMPGQGDLFAEIPA